MLEKKTVKKKLKEPVKKRKTLAKTKQGNTVAQSLENVKAALRGIPK